MIKESASALSSLFSDFLNVALLVQKIHELEEKGDQCAREISKHLSLTFITSIDREDIHELSLVQEEVLNLIKAIAARVGLYQFKKISKVAVELVDNLKSMVDLTSEMLSGYVLKKDVAECSARVKKLKDQSDALLLVALGEMYESNLPGSNSVLDTVKWTHIYDRIEQAIVRTEELANIIEGIALKYA